MKRVAGMTMCAAVWISAAALASEADTSAWAGAGRGRTGSAGATAHYEGDAGFARTDSRSGATSLARGVAIGVDEDGLSLSISHAIAPRSGPALATTFNMSIGEDGRVSTSGGLSVAESPLQRSVRAGGSAATYGPALASAGGSTDRFGTVHARTWAEDSGPRPRATWTGGERRDDSPRVMKLARIRRP